MILNRLVLFLSHVICPVMLMMCVAQFWRKSPRLTLFNMQSFEPFIHNGFVSLSSDLTNSNPVKILRDICASQSLLLANSLPFSDVSFTGTNVLIKGVDSTEFTSIPLHNAYLSSNLVSGHVVVGILRSLPFDGVYLLLGNDLAGSKV